MTDKPSKDSLAEQYSEKIDNAREKHGYTGGSIITKMQNDGTGSEYGPYAWHVAPPSAERKWTYLGPVRGSIQSDGKSSNESDSAAELAATRGDVPDWVPDTPAVLAGKSDTNVEIDDNGGTVTITLPNGTTRAEYNEESNTATVAAGGVISMWEFKGSHEDADEVLKLLTDHPKYGDIETEAFGGKVNAEFADGETVSVEVPQTTSTGSDYLSVGGSRVPGTQLRQALDASTEYENDDSPSADNSVRLAGVKDTDEGTKVLLSGDYDNKSDIKDLNYDKTQRSWNGEYWEVDADSIEYVEAELTSKGFEVAKNAVVKAIESA
mgnify:CR=1 FL=1